jgi:Raf kinase inhibitor-like YbhB/YbcL family protein
MKNSATVLMPLVALLSCAAPQKSAKPEAAEKGANKRMLLVSTAFTDGNRIPVKYTGYGANVSPDLAWTRVPEGTRSFALVCRDPDAPAGTFYHWVAFNIPDTVRQLPENMPKTVGLACGGAQGKNSFRHTGYDGPRPPSGSVHRYYFDLYALDGTLVLSQDADAGELLAALTGHVLATASLMGTYAQWQKDVLYGH